MFTDYKTWSKKRYGMPLFRVPVEIASSCPHGRCAFCPASGAKAQQIQKQAAPLEQIEAAIKFSKRRYRAQKMMLYVQAFTADLTDPAQQQQILKCLVNYKFEAVSIGTRPDCLSNDALEFLERLKSFGEVWIELGIQTTNDDTLTRMNRGHDWQCSKDAILKLAACGVQVAAHVIIGLPGENSDDWNRTAGELAQLPIAGIKIHNLHITKGTRLAEEFSSAPFPLLNHWEYAEALLEFLRRIPAHVPVMRIFTDTPQEELIAPQWHVEKGQFLDYVSRQMIMRDIRQGDLDWNNGTKECWNDENFDNPLFHHSNIPVLTDDGSITFFSTDWKEHYHTKTGARLEAEKKFVEPSKLKERLNSGDVHLLDVCFGLGNNSLAAVSAGRGGSMSRPCGALSGHALPKLKITALEMDKRIVRAAAKNFIPEKSDPADWRKILSELLQFNKSEIGNHKLEILFGDARWLIQNLPDHSFEVIFHDPFSSQHCPELWTVEFFRQLFRVLKPDGVLLTYSSSLPVRGAMHEAGFFTAETLPGNLMSNGTIAAKTIEPLAGFRIIEKEYSRRSTPYYDPHLCDTSKTILRRRQEMIENR
ncbi:MAG: TIGR01212 family radical SAM protein [Kiritimatiellales bacterium]